MKLIEKRCPNCGAGLSFSENDKSIQCEYCKMNYEIQRDFNKHEDNISDEFDLVKGKKIANAFLLYFALSSIIPFIIFLFIFGMAVFIIFKAIFHML